MTKNGEEMNIKDIITGVLENIEREFGGFPVEFTGALSVMPKYRRVGGREYEAHNVRCGDAAFLVQCLESDAIPLGVADNIWFDIPQLNDGRKVRYYVHNDMGYGIEHWESFINLVHSLEKARKCCLLPSAWEQKLVG